MALFRNGIVAQPLRHGPPDELGAVEIVRALETVAPVKGDVGVDLSTCPGEHAGARLGGQRQPEQAHLVNITQEGFKRHSAHGAYVIDFGACLLRLARARIGVDHHEIAVLTGGNDKAYMAPALVAVGPARRQLRPHCRTRPLEDEIAWLQFTGKRLCQDAAPFCFRAGMRLKGCQQHKAEGG